MSEAVIGLTKLFNRLVRMKRKSSDMTPALKAAGVYMLGSIEKNFRAQGRPTKWTGLSKATLARRRRGRGKGSPQILIDKARLKNSMTTRETSDTLQIGTNVVYAARHHFGYPGGTGRGRSKTPARPFLMFQKEDAKAIEKIFNRHLSKA